MDSPAERVHAPFRARPLAALRRAAVAKLSVRDPDYLRRATEGFRFADAASAARTREVAASFLAGYNLLAAGGGPEEVAVAAAGVDPYLRPFFFEGAAMGFGPYALHRGVRPEAFEAFVASLSPATLYQNYVGYGWWLATVGGRFPRRIARVVSGLDFRYRLLCYEGVGFRDGFLGPEPPRRRSTGLLPGDAPARHLWFQGYGRSLWFRYMGDLPAALRITAELPADYRADAVSGLGTALAFSWLDRIEHLPQLMRAVPPAWAPEFEQGLSFGWEARQLADRPLFDEHLGRLDPMTRRRVMSQIDQVHRVRDELLRRPHVPDFYNTWRRRLVQLRREADSPLFARTGQRSVE